MTDPELDFWELRPTSTGISQLPRSTQGRRSITQRRVYVHYEQMFQVLFLVPCSRGSSFYLTHYVHTMIYSHTPVNTSRHRSHNTVDSWQTNTLLAPVEICSHPALASIRDTGPLAVSAQLSHHDGPHLSHSFYLHQHADFQRDLQSLTVLLLQNSSASVG